MAVYRIICLLIGYLFGCFLPAQAIARRKTGRDVSEIGSGNPGMANVMANLGKGPGIAVLAGDLLKTALACLLAGILFWGKIGRLAPLYGGFGVIAGHNYPFWRHWNGGKGVSATCAWTSLCFSWQGILCCIAGGLVVLFTGWLPLGAVVISALTVPVGFWLTGMEGGILAVLSFAMMLQRHWHGLRRIFRGEEARHMKLFGKKK